MPGTCQDITCDLTSLETPQSKHSTHPSRPSRPWPTPPLRRRARPLQNPPRRKRHVFAASDELLRLRQAGQIACKPSALSKAAPTGTLRKISQVSRESTSSCHLLPVRRASTQRPTAGCHVLGNDTSSRANDFQPTSNSHPLPRPGHAPQLREQIRRIQMRLISRSTTTRPPRSPACPRPLPSTEMDPPHRRPSSPASLHKGRTPLWIP